MSTTARKARKRAGVPFAKPQKTPTPPEQRSYVTELVRGPATTRNAGRLQPRSPKKVARFLQDRTPTEESKSFLRTLKGAVDDYLEKAA